MGRLEQEEEEDILRLGRIRKHWLLQVGAFFSTCPRALAVKYADIVDFSTIEFVD